MLSDILRTWPPGPGLDETVTGTKQRLLANEPLHGFTENLDDLHEPAWWTGVKIITVENVAAFSVRLIDRIGQPFFEDHCVWDQSAGEWQMFPWPIPAALAALRGLQIRISRIDNDEPLFVSMKTCFHEMTMMDQVGPYLFMDDMDAPVFYWHGDLWSTPTRGLPLPMDVQCRPIPSIASLDKWNTGHRFIFRGWNADAGRMDIN